MFLAMKVNFEVLLLRVLWKFWLAGVLADNFGVRYTFLNSGV